MNLPTAVTPPRPEPGDTAALLYARLGAFGLSWLVKGAELDVLLGVRA